MRKLVRGINLKTRILFVVVALILAGVWGLATHATTVLQADLEKLLSDQLSATAEYVAGDIDAKLQLRLDWLREAAQAITPDLMAEPERLTTLLAQRAPPVGLFAGGVFVANRQGYNIADYPSVPGRVGGFVGDRGYFQDIVGGRREAVGRPVQGRFSKQPVISLAVPLRDAGGTVVGAMVAAAYPSDPTLFGLIEGSRMSRSSFFVVISPRDQVFVSATDKSRIMQPLPARGVNRLLDQRLYEGFEGAGIVVNSLGVETLATSRRIKSTGWIVIAGMPTAEAFSPIATLKRQIHLAALALSLALSAILYLILRRQLAPLEKAGAAMQRMTEGKEAFAPLPVGQEDEIGALVSSFNRLITERKRAEEAHARLATIVESSGDAIISRALDGRIESWNAAAERLLGYTAGEIIGKDVSVLVPADLAQAHAANIRTINQGLRIEPYDTVRVARSGQRIDVSLSVSHYEDETGRIGGAALIMRDITERKRAERIMKLEHAVTRCLEEAAGETAALLAVIHTLCESERWACGRFFRVDETAGVLRFAGFWGVPGDAIARFHAISRSLTFKPGEGLAGQVWQSAQPLWIPDVSKDPRVKHVLLAREGGLYGAYVFPVVADGDVIGVFTFASAEVREPDERLIKAMEVIGSQIGQVLRRKKAEREIHLLNADLERRVAERTEELKAANRQLESFSYSVSHDLRAPLRSISGFAQILLQEAGAKLDAGELRHLERISLNAEKMSALIDDLLRFSRMSRANLKRSRIDLGEMVGEVVRELREAYPRTEVQVGRLPEVSADPAMLRQALLNLIANALKFSAGREHPRVEIGCTPEASPPVFFVRDNGAGFDMQYAHKLFGVFQRLHRTSEFEGTGVGLAIVSAIILRHGGRIWAEAAVGQGATFFFTLPDSAAAGLAAHGPAAPLRTEPAPA